jgi:hypothetical protein
MIPIFISLITHIFTKRKEFTRKIFKVFELKYKLITPVSNKETEIHFSKEEYYILIILSLFLVEKKAWNSEFKKIILEKTKDPNFSKLE